MVFSKWLIEFMSNFKYVVCSFNIGIFLLFTISVGCAKNMLNFYNVGQGNFTMIELDDNVIIVDAGHGGNIFNHDPSGVLLANDELSGFKINLTVKNDYMTRKKLKNASLLKSKNLIVILSHDDRDHYNLMEYWFKLNFKNKKLYYREDQSVKKTIEDQFSDYNIQKHPLSKTETLKFGEHVIKLIIGNPIGGKSNDKSIIVVLKYKNGSETIKIVIPGDATEKTYTSIQSENREIKEADILLASHHGADTEGSNSTQIINKLNPSVVVFSAALFSQYYHPKTDVLLEYNKILLEKHSLRDMESGARSSRQGRRG